MNWTQDYENILESLRLNSVYMSRSHKKKYFAFKRMSNWFRVPTIVLSAFASVIAVGSEPYLKQQNISGITCLVSMIVGILNSIELYLKLQEAIESELDKSKQWYALAAEIYKVTGLEAVHRDDNPAKLLNGFYDKYMELFHESSLNGIHYGDRLLNVPSKTLGGMVSSAMSSSSSSINSNDGDISPLVKRDQVLEEQL
jgi:hypothetical protein